MSSGPVSKDTDGLITFLDYALKYHSIGINTIPLKPKDKVTLGAWKKYQTERAQKAELAAWFDPHNKNQNNIGIVMGKISGVFALDIDGDEAQKRFAKKLQDPESGLPPELNIKIMSGILVRTGSGTGRHVILGYEPSEWPDGEIKTRQLFLDRHNKHTEIKLKGEGGYLVGAPSVHPDTGRPYEIVSEHMNIVKLSRAEIEAMVKAINPGEVEKISGEKPQTKAQQTDQAVATNVLTLSAEEMQAIIEPLQEVYIEGARNDVIFALSGYLRKAGVTKDQAKILVKVLAERKGDAEVYHRLRVVETTYEKEDINKLSGYNALLDIVHRIIVDDTKSFDIITEITEIIKKKKPNLISSEQSRAIAAEAQKGLDIIVEATGWIMEKYHFMTIAESRELRYYKDGIYLPGGDIIIEADVEQEWIDQIGTAEIEEVKNRVMRRTFVPLKEIDGNTRIINLVNGLLDIETGKFENHKPEYFSITQIPVRYEPKAVCPKIVKFLREVLRKEDLGIALEFMAYCMYRGMPIQKAMMLTGEGNNGKSVFIGLLKGFLGKQNISSVSLQDFEENKFRVAELYGKLANLYADVSARGLENTGMFKMLVAGDILTAERKYGQPFQFENFAKMIFSANKVPITSDETDAFYRRWIVLPFNVYIPPEREDERLIFKLTEPQELSGLLNMLVSHLKKLLRIGMHRRYKDIETTKKAYEKNSNPIKFFYNACLRLARENEEPNFESKDDVYNAYERYCKYEGLAVLRKEKFGEELSKIGLKDARPRVDGKRVYVWENIRLVDFLRIRDEDEGQRGLF